MVKYINLRPHHFLCIPGYKGYGYSREFKVNMEKVIDELNAGIKAKITLKDDDICKSCTNPKNNICSTSFVEKLDRTVMGILNIKEGELIDFSEKMDLLKTKVDSKSHKQICAECIWMRKGLCENTFK